ncbi:uncharacterized protein LOC128928915 [Callithrix jacchus]
MGCAHPQSLIVTSSESHCDDIVTWCHGPASSGFPGESWISLGGQERRAEGGGEELGPVEVGVWVGGLWREDLGSWRLPSNDPPCSHPEGPSRSKAWRSGPLLPTEDTSRERLSGPKEDPPGRRRRADVGNGQKDVWLQPFQQTPWEREGLRPRAGALPTPDLLGRSKCTDIGKGQRKGVWLQRSLQTPETGVRCLYSQHIVSLCALSFAPCYQMRSPRECCHVITDTRCKRKPSPSSPPSPSPPVQMERRHREVIVCPGLPASWWQSHGSDGMNVVILRRQGVDNESSRSALGCGSGQHCNEEKTLCVLPSVTVEMVHLAGHLAAPWEGVTVGMVLASGCPPGRG